jgi:signal transduction histidine kinase/ActR/RegA family two-component response regulator
MLRAIRHGEIDALVVEGAGGSQVYTLHSAEEPYRNLVEQMQEGAVVVSGDGDILYSNARFAALVGEPAQSVVGRRFDQFVNASERDEFDRWLRGGGGSCRSRLIGSDSCVFDVSLSLTTTASPGGDRLNLIVTDLRELLEANSNRDRAEQESRTKDEFLATLAHELRNPLGAIGNAVGMLELTHAAGVPATRAHAVIARQVGYISHLIEELLDVERVVSGKIRLDRKPLDLAEAVERALATVAGGSALDRAIDVRTESVWVEGDPGRLEQVLTNLVTNAVKYTPPGGHIRVTLCADGGEAVLSVEDTGFGISPRLLPFIFDMYVQADRTLARARGGLGIGLALVRRLVELHGGTIVASSEGEGHGSRFVVRLKQIPWAGVSAETVVSRERRTRRRRVLLIEDSVQARQTLRTVLELAGHVVYDAADGVRGLELLKAVRPDVGIIDVSLPGMDGYQLARRVREQPHGRHMLLLALTSVDSPSATRRSPVRGFDHHLIKPVDLNQLAVLLNEGAEGSRETVHL